MYESRNCFSDAESLNCEPTLNLETVFLTLNLGTVKAAREGERL